MQPLLRRRRWQQGLERQGRDAAGICFTQGLTLLVRLIVGRCDAARSGAKHRLLQPLDILLCGRMLRGALLLSPLLRAAQRV